ncbi:MAG TPA: phytanoyl-CoA dioxygenase family protein [Anaerolineae bacterium]|nr:phytanoyl-CoA dioxygenase family protein [Anaerolineae bacterium]
MSQPTLGALREANAYLDDFERLNALFYDEGYLFFRNVLDLEEVDRVKRDMVHVLQEQGIVKRGETEPIWTGASLDALRDDDLYALESYAALCEGSAKRIVEKTFGEPAFMFKGPTLRYALPADAAHVTPAHQDYFFIRANDRFRTLWMPLMEIDEQVGGLVITPGSHKEGLREHVEREDVFSYVLKGRKQKGVALDDIAPPWLTTHYQPGDVLIFHNLTLHWALPNTSDRVRLSIDTRAQPADVPRTFQMAKTIPEQRNYRKEVQRLAREEGASEALFELVVIEMMKRDLPPERENVKQLMSELETMPE